MMSNLVQHEVEMFVQYLIADMKDAFKDLAPELEKANWDEFRDKMYEICEESFDEGTRLEDAEAPGEVINIRLFHPSPVPLSGLIAIANNRGYTSLQEQIKFATDFAKEINR